MVESEDYSATEEADGFMWMDPLSTKKGNANDKKRRFSEEQVKSLELMFETQTKLEPRKKLQLAKELGLHPRQVAIWFQNKRARWKSKQLERQYAALRADYDALLSNFESLKHEKQLLAKQLQKLAELLEKPMEERGNESDQEKADQRPNLMLTEKTEMRLMSSDDDEENRHTRCSEKEKDFFSGPPTGGSLVPSEQQFCFHQPSWPTDQACANSQWWEFWPMNE
ncbi:uncharacterized protein A4U43_C08F290 [Asparagus officinalis]|uniref:homeobox-leucine zipper protein HOX6-like n=1 Tax=Asparagus officinalis TaxID=4686 RepID=UPI00098E6553|nr:homeobox-leucine zipper protein HOX6-like [Asparagus officinalis]ONK58841.1 uncharacterized protein A4U43_C08F290 [Asparagus officinalis]